MHIQGHLIYCAMWAKVSHCQPLQEATAFRASYPVPYHQFHHGRGAEATSPVGAPSHLAQPPGQGCCYQSASPELH